MRVLVAFVALAVATALLGAAIKTWTPAIDLQIVQAVAGHRSASLTTVARIVTEAGSLAFLVPLMIVLLALRRWKQPADDIALILVTTGCAVLPWATKLIVARPRPTIEQLVQVASLSFPSGHATQAAGVYLAIALVLGTGSGRRSTPAIAITVAILLALAVAATRIYLGVHFPSDVIGGLLLGWSWTLLIFYWARPALTRTLAGPVTAANGAATD